VTKEKNIDSIELMEATQASFDYSKWENPMGESKKDALRVGIKNHAFLPFFKKTASKTKNLNSSR